ncbi:MAG: hypothetical protein DRP51_10490 [Candidatus Zixiibacteriota bacterium]|nr:MAG: hypothetical protein DRP51_10490 [candidate division Zixibacteria bacterium]
MENEKMITIILKIGMMALIVILVATSSDLNASDWWKKIKINGDFRYRHETTDKENNDIRHRQRIRARLNIIGQVSDETKIVLGISAGSDDPVSSNQTLTNAFSSKKLLLDMAYFEMNLTAVPGLKLIGGKAKNQFYRPGKSELIWDSDLRHEGVAINYSRKLNNLSINIIGAGLWIQERKADNDSYLAGGQTFFIYNLFDKKGTITLGGSYFSYGNIKGFPTFYDSEEKKGNTVMPIASGTNTTYNYSTNFELIEVFGTFDFKAGQIPVTIMGDYVTNTATDSLNNGWLVGFRIGKIKEPSSWALRYTYRNLGADAVVGAFTNSDFGGGGTDAKGHEIGGNYQLMDNTTLALTYFNNQIELENENKTDYQKWQIDLKFKF